LLRRRKSGGTHTIIIEPQPQPPEQVFALATPAHVLNKLYWEVRQIEISLETEHKLAFAHAPAYHAFNCAITSWHLTDWVWESADSETRTRICERLNATFNVSVKDSLEKFQAAICTKHHSIYICRQIATGSKHVNIRKPDPAIRTEEVWQPQAVAGLMECRRTPLGSYLYRLSLIDNGIQREVLDIFREALLGGRARLVGIYCRSLRRPGNERSLRAFPGTQRTHFNPHFTRRFSAACLPLLLTMSKAVLAPIFMTAL
jgi:hypothetical protein